MRPPATGGWASSCQRLPLAWYLPLGAWCLPLESALAQVPRQQRPQARVPQLVRVPVPPRVPQRVQELVL